MKSAEPLYTTDSIKNRDSIKDRGNIPVLVLSVEDARAVVGQSAQTGAENGDLALLTARLGRVVGGRQRPDERGVWCYVVEQDGGFHGVFWSHRNRVGFIVPRHPKLAANILSNKVSFENYRANLHHRLARIDTTHEVYLRDELQEARIVAAAHACGALSSPEDELVHSDFRVEVRDSDIEFFVPTETSRARPESAGRQVEDSVDVLGLTDRLLASYEDPRQTHNRYSGKHPLPNRKKVIKFTEGLLAILFPGYYGLRPNSNRFPSYLRRRLSWIRENVTTQIERSLHFQHASDPTEEELSVWEETDYRSWAEEKADNLLNALAGIRKVLEQDVKATLEADPAIWDHHEIMESYPGIYATGVYRIAHKLAEEGVPLIPRMMTEHAHSKTGIDIHPEATIGAGFVIDHGTGVVIGQTTKIGRNVTLYQGVTLGALSFPRDDNGNLVRGSAIKRHPTLEDEVVVYSNASILGGNTVVGRNSVIGANVWLPHSVPPEKIAWIEERALRFKDLTKPVPKVRDNLGDGI